ncbi:MFS transporter [Microbacterium sp. UMB0228]|nr:MFS transporter [Microbacterium sp. UMB0228]
MTSAVKGRQEVTHIDSNEAGRVARAAFVGTALEWYDYFLFGTAAALVFNRLFFTDLHPTAGTLAALATFGVGFAARPLGSVIFGFMGDRMGRKPTLILTIILIGLATGLIGLLPDFGSIGLAAPILLAVLRLLQGLAVGGEWGGAMTLAVEHSPVEKRGRYSALVQLGSPVGTLLSSGAFALVLLFPNDVFDAWGWRLPFLAAFPLLIIAVVIRIRVEESPVFEEFVKQEQVAKIPAAEVFKTAWGRLLVAVGAALLGVGGFYVMTTFAVSYGTSTLGLDRQLLVNATTIAAVVQGVLVLVVGRLSERIGAGRMTMIGAGLSALSAFPLYMLIDTGHPAAVIVAVSAGVAIVSISYAVTGTLLTELFPARVRYTGVALGYNVAGALAGFLPFIATWSLSLSGGASWPVSTILIILAAITAIAGYFGAKLRIDDDADAT